MAKERERLDDRVIREPMRDLSEAIQMLVDRDFPRQYQPIIGFHVLVQGNLRISTTSAQAIRYLCTDAPVDPGHQKEFVVAAFPVARTILESLFALVFLFDDPKENTNWYYRSTLRILYEQLERWKRKFSNVEDWHDFLEQRESYLLGNAAQMGLSLEQISSSDSNKKRGIKRFPTPSRMVQGNAIKEQQRKEFLQFLNQWYYGWLSEASHLSGSRLIPANYMLAGETFHGPYALTWELYKTEAVVTSDTLLLAILSEIIVECGYDLKPKAQYIWTLLSLNNPFSKVLYEKRYQQILSRATA